MADIYPIIRDLDDIYDKVPGYSDPRVRDYIDVEITASIVPITEQYVEFSFDGCSVDPLPDDIQVDLLPDTNPASGVPIKYRIHGSYLNYFETYKNPDLPLTYRERDSGNYVSVNGFENLPSDATTCDVIEFDPPGSDTDRIEFYFTLKYIANVTTIPTPMELKVTFFQDLHSTYASYSAALRTYISASGDWET